MNSRKYLVGVSLLALATGGAGAWTLTQSHDRPDQPEEREEGDEEIITLERAPAPVRAAALKLAGDTGHITKVIKEEDAVQYEVEYNADAAKCSAIFSSAGDVMEIEKGTAQDKLPAAALEALKKNYPGS